MIVIGDTEETWTVRLPGSGLRPRKGLVITLAPEALSMNDAKSKRPEGETSWQVTGVRYRVRSEEDSFLEVTVEPVKTPWRWPVFENEETQFNVALGLGFGTVALVLGLTIWLSIVSADTRWWIIGRNIRWIVGWTFFVTFSLVIPLRLGVRRSNPFWDNYLTAVFSLTGIFLTLAWLVFAVPPEKGDYARFGRDMVASLSFHNLPFLLATLPWAAAGFKLLGMERAEKTSDAVLKITKKE